MADLVYDQKSYFVFRRDEEGGSGNRYSSSQMSQNGYRYPSLTEYLDIYIASLEGNLSCQAFLKNAKANYFWTNDAFEIQDHNLIIYKGVEGLEWQEYTAPREMGGGQGYRYQTPDFHYRESETFKLKGIRDHWEWLSNFSDTFIEFLCNRLPSELPPAFLKPETHPHEGATTVRIDLPNKSGVLPISWFPVAWGHIGCYGGTVGIKLS